MIENDLNEVIFQVLIGRMEGRQDFVKPIEEQTVITLLKTAENILHDEPIVLRIEPQATIVGDIHGNIDDLIRIFQRLRYPPSMKYIFMGDYIDRGMYGTEVMLLLLALKIKFPQSIYLLRGNHESRSLTSYYGFFREVTGKYSSNVYDAFVDVFHQLPLCAVLGGKILCLHGGISPEWDTIEQLEAMQKPEEISGPGIFTDIIWSDPDQTIEEFVPNDRGCGYFYGTVALDRFLNNNDIDLLVRSHELCEDGISWPYIDQENCLDRCLTIFSNTNYCDHTNSSSVLVVSDQLCVRIEKFEPFSYLQEFNIVLPIWLYNFTRQKETDVYNDQTDEEEEDSFSISSSFSDENQLPDMKKQGDLNSLLTPVFHSSLNV